MARHGMARHGMARHGTAWHGMAWHGTAWHGMAWHGGHLRKECRQVALERSAGSRPTTVKREELLSTATRLWGGTTHQHTGHGREVRQVEGEWEWEVEVEEWRVAMVPLVSSD